MTSRPAKLRVTERSILQNGLDFIDSVTTIKQRGKDFFCNNWFITQETVRELLVKYLKAHPSNPVSRGYFHELKPFYIRHTTPKDIEMCVCKSHLHARWAVQALIDCASEQNICLNQIHDYNTFNEYLTSDCTSDEFTYIEWKCTPSKNQACRHIIGKWEELKNSVSNNDKNVTVKMQQFRYEKYTTREGKEGKRLKAVSEDVNMETIIQFIDSFLTNFIHHRNHLKHYRSVIHELREQDDALWIDVDLSENLQVPVKEEPQAMHWSHEQITVHSGIVKVNGHKVYHPYLCAEKEHDQQTVATAINKIVGHSSILYTPTEPNIIIIESDNAVQYKYTQHFHEIQKLSNRMNKTIIRVYGIAQHGKGEVDHVGGIAKNTLRKAIAERKVFQNVEQMCEYLQTKFADNTHPKYHVDVINEEELQEARLEASKHLYGRIVGASTFQVIVFTPNSTTMKTAPRICICEVCKANYGSCELFNEVELPVTTAKVSVLRSSRTEPVCQKPDEDTRYTYQPGSVCAIAPAEDARELMWFVKITAQDNAKTNIQDDYSHMIFKGENYLTGRYLEYHSETYKHKKYNVMKKDLFIREESVIYPFVLHEINEKQHVCKISFQEYTDILNYIDNSVK
jgi:hypothetical protein